MRNSSHTTRVIELNKSVGVRYAYRLFTFSTVLSLVGLVWVFVGEPIVGIALIVFAGIWISQSQDLIRDALRDQLINEVEEFLERLEARSVRDAK